MDMREEIIRLGPWHLDVQVTPGISTRVFREAAEGSYPANFGEVSFIDYRPGFLDMMKKIYPKGLEGRRVLDSACNCGGHLFWAKEIGAGACFGFDVRKFWIDQANFLARNRTEPSDGIRFEVCDLYDLPKHNLGRFDITIFKGIFYHLPDPIAGLKIAADLTEELLIVNTVTQNGLPDGLLAVAEESREQLMSGVYGLGWNPTGPDVLTRILKWMGFIDVRCHWWRRDSGPNQQKGVGRIEMLASRREGLLDEFASQDLGQRRSHVSVVRRALSALLRSR